MVGQGAETTGSLRSRVVRGRPNWWVILAVSLALMALLVATAGGPSHARGTPGPGHTAAIDATPSPGTGARARTPADTTTSTTAAPPVSTPSQPPAPSSGSGAGDPTSLASSSRRSATAATPTTNPAPAPTATTTTTSPPGTTTTAAGLAQPSDRSETEGYLDPPVQSSTDFDFAATGATEVSVLWSGDTYLTLHVSCAGSEQDAGGTSAMQVSLADAGGECGATVSEPAPGSTPLTFTFSTGPAGG